MATPSLTLNLASPPKHSALALEAQKLLEKSAYGSFYGGKLDGIYGEKTAAAVHLAKDRLGYPQAKVNQVCGPVLLAYLSGAKPLPAEYAKRRKARLAALKAPKPQTHGAKALAIAKTYLGVKESPSGSNRQQFGAWFGVNGEPWCAIFVSFCLYHAGYKHVATKWPYRWTYVPTLAADAVAGRYDLLTTHAPVHGDIVTFDWDGDGVPDHVGFFDHWVVEGQTFATVEGNTEPTDAGDQSNGGEVCAKTRTVPTVHSFIHVKG
jgi:hypothetical protein